MSERDTMGKRIAGARMNTGLSQRQLASLAGVGTNTVSMYEHDIRQPSITVLIRLSRILHVSTDYLLLGKENMYIDASGLDDREVRVLTELVEILSERYN